MSRWKEGHGDQVLSMDIGALGPLIKWSVPYLNLVPYATLFVPRVGDTKPRERRREDLRSPVLRVFESLSRFSRDRSRGNIEWRGGTRGLYRGSPL